MTLLALGYTGQVARELRYLSRVLALGRDKADLSDPRSCVEVIRTLAPRAVINAAAYTAVDRAEMEEDLATRVNGEAPAAMAQVCTEMDIPFVHLSTDYVFSGEGNKAARPEDATAPCNAYGRSKLAGELGVRAAGGRHVILRTSWVFSAHGANFVKTMLRLARNRDEISVVSDQVGGPTPARAIAAACLSISDQLITNPEKSGTYHFSGAPDTSWYDFAKEIFSQSGSRIKVNPIPSSAYPTPATRPLNSRLDCSLTETCFGIARPDWRQGLSEVLSDLEMEK